MSAGRVQLRVSALALLLVPILSFAEYHNPEVRRGRTTLLPPQITYDTKTDSRSTVHVGPDLSGNFQSGDLKLTSTTDEVTTSKAVTPVTTTRTEYRTEGQFVTKTFYSLECNYEPGGGSSEAWNRFYNGASGRTAKVDALKDAIKGVGDATAEKLYDDGVFSTKPRTWNEFSRRIISASERYRTGFAVQVLETYKEDNMRNLGYKADDLICDEVPYTATVWEEVSVPREVETTKDEVQESSSRRAHSSNSQDFEIKASGGKLLKGEQESFSVHLKGYEDWAQANSNYNTYQQRRVVAPTGKVVYEFTGQRRRVNPENSLQGKAVVNKQKQYFLEVSDSNYEPANGDTAIVNVTVIRHYKGKFLGIMNKSEVIETKSMRLNPGGRLTQVPIDLSKVNAGKNETYEIKYTLQHSGSQFFSGEKSSERTTGKIRK